MARAHTSASHRCYRELRVAGPTKPLESISHSIVGDDYKGEDTEDAGYDRIRGRPRIA